MRPAMSWMCPRHVTPQLPATPRASLLRCILVAACISVMPPDADEWAVVERRGPHLLELARPFVIHGSNTYWLVYFAADPATRPTVTAALPEAADAGLNVCRTWAFNDGGYRALQLQPFSYDEDVFQVSLGCFGWALHNACLMKCVAECRVRLDQIAWVYGSCYLAFFLCARGAYYISLS
ncbi:hypothetical protein C2845_PM17G00250 [Panicum miliaceum]|uniref:Uncharacterized protein n=1 Tax=Panicum miliaceum TaxID=4540 RepID=A0A3L6Q2J4_PANMI|nr:hypothetical protein C2845_PM17G00250 [Panicum miliaceum]